MLYSFEDIFYPITKNIFFEEYYEKKPLFISKESNGFLYSNIFTLDDLDRFISESKMIWPYVRLVKGGQTISPTEYTQNEIVHNSYNVEGIIDKEKLFFYFLEGYTIIFNSLDKSSYKLLILRHLFEKELGVNAQVNLYLTPKKSQGFKAHWDTHDVFIFQISGSKEWNIYNSPMELPSHRQTYNGECSNVKPKEKIKLKEGDLLYLPRGFVHEAFSSDEISLHITLGIKPILNIDILNMIFSSIDEKLFFRKSIFSDKISGIENLKEKFIEEVLEFLKQQDFSNIIDLLKNKQERKKPFDLRHRLNSCHILDSLNLDSEIIIKENLYYIKSDKNEKLEIRFNNKTIKFPLFIGQIIEYIEKTGIVKISELLKFIDEDGLFVFCKKLIEEGFFTICFTNDNGK